MTPIAQMDCCTMLGITPKTLHNWLRHANMQFSPHPTDARLKCLLFEQVQQLAALHARPLQVPPPASPALAVNIPPLASPPAQTPVLPVPEASPVSLSRSLSAEAELRNVVGSLEAKVQTLQEQLASLAVELLRERTQRYEQRLSALEALLPSPVGNASSVQASVPETTPHLLCLSAPARSLHPAETFARSRIVPRIEWGPDGHYGVICPKEGSLSFSPDSPAWFDWLASLSSFRFLGSQGRFTAYREGQTRMWKAYRTFHGRPHRRYLGITDRLTIARLEQVAASLQSEITSLS